MARGGPARAPTARQARLDAILAVPPVSYGRRVMARYDAVGGSLLSAGLAYSALFALVPGVILTLGIAGVLLGDGRAHDALIRNVVTVIPPFKELLGPAIDELASRSASVTLIGVLGLAWGASRFYVALEEVMDRVFDGPRRRSFVRRTLLRFVSVAILGLAFGLVTVLATLSAFFDAAAAQGARPLADVAGPVLELLGLVSTVSAVALLYRFVPRRRPAWPAITLPAVTVALVVIVVTRLFVFLAPRLIGAAAVLGTVGTVFAALAWLGVSFQALLLGAAWIDVADRDIVARRAG